MRSNPENYLSYVRRHDCWVYSIVFYISLACISVYLKRTSNAEYIFDFLVDTSIDTNYTDYKIFSSSMIYLSNIL